MIRTSFILLCILFICLIGSCSQQSSIKAIEEDERIIQGLETEIIEALSDKDLDRYTSLYADDATVFYPEKPPIIGRDALRSVWKEMFASPGLALEMRAEKSEVSRGGDLAYAHGSYTLTINDDSGTSTTEKGNYMVIFKKQNDGQWKIVIDMATPDHPVSDSVSLNAAPDWPSYLGPNNDLQPELEEFTATTADEVWRVQLKTGMCSVSIANGLLYTMGNDGTKGDEETAKDYVYCLDAKTGEVKWTFDYPCQLEPKLHPGGPSSTPTIHEGRVYTLSKFGQIFCLDAKTGQKIWEASAEQYKPEKPWWGFAASPTIMGNAVIFNIGTKGMALHKDTGEVLWKSDGSAVAYATPKPLPLSLFNRPSVAIFTNENFFILDPATGESLASYSKTWEEKSNCNAITPYIYDGGFYLFHSAHGMARLSLKEDTLTQDWLSEDGKYPNEWFAFNTHVIHDGNIYFLSGGRTSAEKGLHCVNARTGKKVYFDQTFEFGNLIGVGNRMIMLTETGQLVWGDLIDTKFKETYRKKILEGLCWAVPVLIGDHLFARDAQGGLVCLQLK